MHEAIEFDFAARGIDLLDLYRGELSPRKALILICNLPADSAFAAAMQRVRDREELRELNERNERYKRHQESRAEALANDDR